MSRVKLGDVAVERRETCKIDKEKYPIVGLEHIIPEDIILSSWDVNKENSFTRKFYKDDILFGRRRAYLKKAAIAPFEGICSGDITVINALPDKIEPSLLPFIIQNDNLFDFAVGKSAGSLSPRVKWEHLKNYEFELPTRVEQKKLSNILWAYNSLKKSYEELLKRTDELVKSQFIEMFGNPLSNDKDWNTEKMKEVAPSIKLDEEVESNDGKYWLLNLDKVESNTGKVLEKVMVDKKEIGSSTSSFSYDHVLYSKLRPYLNKVVIPDSNGYATTELVTLKPDKNKITRIFLGHLLRGDEFVSYIETKVSGTKMPRVSMKVFWDFDLILPPIELQNEFAEFVKQSDKSKFELEKSMKSLERAYKKIIDENLK